MRDLKWWRRLLSGAVVMMLVGMASAHAASAATVSVSATAAGSTVSVQVSGTGDDCAASPYSPCSAQTVEVEVEPDSEAYGICDAVPTPQLSWPTATTGGAYSFSGSVPVQSGQGYLVCAYVTQTLYGVALSQATGQTAVTSPPEACPARGPHALSVVAPAQLAIGRDATIKIRPNLNSSASVSGSSATVTAQQTGAAQPFYTASLNSTQVARLGSYNSVTLYLTAPVKPFTTTISYTQTGSDGTGAQCIDQRAVTITPIRGRTPSVTFGHTLSDKANEIGTVILHAPGGCSLARITPEVVQLRGHGHSAVLRAPDQCDGGAWSQRGWVPGVSITPNSSASGTTVVMGPVGHFTRSYQLRVSVAGRVVKRGVLNVSYQHYPANRVWQGTDQFVNYCINDNKKVFSLHLRLYCWDPALTIRSVSITAR